MSDSTGSAGADDRFAPAIPDIVDLQPGQEVRYPLVSAAGAGYVWDVQELDPTGTAELSVRRDEERPASHNPPDDLPTSDPVPLVLVVGGVRPGRSRWQLRLIRPWAPETSLAERTVDVVVGP